ncbi:uncharacterized protein [Haliotis asinina]|uniref:uncharacterized protein isoform X2 n=1 Tax=Haliotis asinina TaxID=109174 RepID=UPI003532257D
MSADIILQSSLLEPGVELLCLEKETLGTSHDKSKEGFVTGSSHREPQDGDMPYPPCRTSVEETNPVESDGEPSAAPTHDSVNELFVTMSGQSGEDETSAETYSIKEKDAEEKTSTLQENKSTMKTPNVEIVSNTHGRTDYNNAASAEYHYIDNVQDSVYEQATEENQPEAENDYEFIAETNPGYDYIEPINDPRTFSRRGIVFLVPIFAGVVVNTMAGFFFVAFLLPIPRVGQMVFSRETSTVFMVVNAAAGFSVGLLRSTGVVATVDHLKTRPAVAVIISYNSFIIGAASSLLARILSDIGLAIPAFLGLVAALFLQKNSQTHQNVTMLFKHPPFYALVLLAAVCSMGFASNPVFAMASKTWTIIMVIAVCIIPIIVLVVLLVIRNKIRFLTEWLKRSALLSMGLSVVGAGVVVTAHKVIPPDLGVFSTGFAFLLSHLMLPVALVSTTERSSLVLALPLLCCCQLTGGIIGAKIADKILRETSSVSGAMYFGGVSQIVAGVGAIIAWVLLVRRGSRPSHVPAEDIIRREGDHPGDGEREDHFEVHVEDHVQDHVEVHVEDHVQDHVQDHVEGQVEDHLQDHVESQVEDHVDNHVVVEAEDSCN